MGSEFSAFGGAGGSSADAWVGFLRKTPAKCAAILAVSGKDRHSSAPKKTDTPTSPMDKIFEFAGNHVVLTTLLMLSFLLVVFTELRRKSAGVTTVEPQAAVALMNANAVVLDLRSAEAFARGHIVNARNIPFDELSANKEKLEKMKSKPIIAVCDAGVTSSRVVDSLRKSGVESVYGLKGGINAWTQANLPLVTAKKTKKKS